MGTTRKSGLVDAEAQAFDGAGAKPAGGVARTFIVGLYQHAIHLHVAGSYLEPGWQSIRNFVMMPLRSIPITPPCGPVIPTSVI